MDYLDFVRGVVLLRSLCLVFLWLLPSSILAASGNEPAELVLYRKLVEDLAAETMEGRGPGTLGLERAREYLADFFRVIELEPGFESSYYQAFDIKPGGKHTTALLNVAGRFLERRHDFVPHLHSGDGAFTGPLVAVAPTALEDASALKDIDMDGKTVLVLPADLTAKEHGAERVLELAHLAADRGARALWLVGALPGYSFKELKKVSDAERASIPVLILSQACLRQLEGLGAVLRHGASSELEVSGKVVMVSRAVTVHNVAAVLPGAGSLANEYVIVGGHYDHLGYGGLRTGTRETLRGIHHGADDNASGTAGVLLLAARFARRCQQDPPSDRRTMIFAGFTAEETGLEGSAYMAANMREMGIEVEDVASMINFDMIGRMSGETFYVCGAQTGYGWWQMTQSAADHYGLNPVRREEYFHRSDQYSFYLQQIPCLFFFGGDHKDYHLVTDTAEKINYPGALRLLQVAEAILYDQWTHPERLRFRRLPKDWRRRNLR